MSSSSSSSNDEDDWMDLHLDDMSLEMRWEEEMLREALGLPPQEVDSKKTPDTTPERTREEKKRTDDSISPDFTPERSPEKTPESPKTYPTFNEKEDTDSRSVYVGNLDWYSNTHDVEEHFQNCGEVIRVTIPMDKVSGMQKNYAFVEFSKASSVEKALQLTGSSIRDRPILVNTKRTNIPGMSSEPSRVHKRGSSHRHGGMYSDKSKGSYMKEATRRCHGSFRGSESRVFKPYDY